MNNILPSENLITSYLERPDLIKEANLLPCYGVLKKTLSNYLYLDIDDRFIDQIFPLLGKPELTKPDYFTDYIGAHISVVYPDESIAIKDKINLFETHYFKVEGIFYAKIANKTYYALSVNAPSLSLIRKQMSLQIKPCFKGYMIDFHITIAINKC